MQGLKRGSATRRGTCEAPRMIVARPTLRLFLVALSFAGTLSSSVARAESAPAPPRCRVSLLPSGTNVPANLPALVVDDTGTSPGLKASVDGVTISGGNTPVKLGVIADTRLPGATLLVPATNDPLESGAVYTIAYGVKCSAGTATDPTGSSTFTSGPAVSLPTTIGTVTELADGTAAIASTPELAAFRRTIGIEAFIDGASIGMTPYGAAATQDEIDVKLYSYGLSIGSSFSPRPPKVCATRAVETHEVKLLAHVAGADGDTAPLTFSVTVDCAQHEASGSSGNPSLPDAGADDRGASGSGDGGCSVGGSSAFSGLAALFMTGAGLVVLLRRRRRGSPLTNR